MKKILQIVGAVLALVGLLNPAYAQFTPGQVLTASQLNSALAGKVAAGTAGTSQLQYLQGATGSVARSLTNKFQDTINFRDFGGKCDGVTNDDAAFAAAIAALAPYKELDFPAGTCVFTTAKVAPVISNAAIRGAGANQTILMYAGANTTNDLLTIGDGTTSMTGWAISGLRFASTTTMTGGAALHLKRMQAGNQLYDVDAGSNVDAHLWNGIWLDNVNIFKYTKFNIRAQNEGLMMNGSPSDDEGSDIYLDDGTVTFCNIAYHIGGGQGGVYFGKVLAFSNNVNYQIDNLLAARKNREIFFGTSAVSDGVKNYGIWINDTLTSNSPIAINAAGIGSAGLVGTGGSGVNIYVQSWPNGRITIGPGQLYNATSHGLQNDDSTVVIDISAERQIFNNGGWGIYSSVAAGNNIRYSGRAWMNTLGNFSPNTYLAPTALTLAAGWSGTPAVINKSGRYLIQGTQTQAHATIAQYATVSTVPVGFWPTVSTSILVVFGGGTASDGMVPGRVNTDGTIQVLQAVGDATNLSFVGEWQLY